MAVRDFKSSGAKCQIISEELWTKNLQATPELRQEGQKPIQGRSKSDQLIQLQRDLDQLRKNQRLIIDAVQKELSPSDYLQIYGAAA
ncbi:MAG: hypothetical protein WDN00_10435 [Limisphaerales bacterium]